MSEKKLDGYGYQRSTDVTKFYLDKLLEGKAPKIGSLNKLFASLQMDRIFQGFIEAYISEQRNHKPAEYIVGLYDMGQAAKAFLCNLDNISREAEAAGEDTLNNQEVRDLLSRGISLNDLSILEESYE